METRHLAVPQLDAAHLGPRQLCYRPCREGPPRMCLEWAGQQLVAHNYGHGGSGWTVGPGATKHVNEMLVRAIREVGTEKFGLSAGAESTFQALSVCVLGAGVIGLFTAYDLVKHGFRNISVVADKFEGLASHFAGGLLCPSVLGSDADSGPLLFQIFTYSYNFYAKIARGEASPDFGRECARMLPTYFSPGHVHLKDLEPYVKAGVMGPAKEVLVRIGANAHPMVVFDDGIFIEPMSNMRSLRRFLEANGVQFLQRRVNAFSELAADVVVNCTGLGAKELCRDPKMYSVQGHLVFLKDQSPSDFNYMLLHHFGAGTTSAGQPVKRDLYIFPKRTTPDGRQVGVIGGTFVTGGTESTPNAEEFELVVRRAREFVGEK